jgi:DNA-directed RNA polymerase specialized sigma24 family protein
VSCHVSGASPRTGLVIERTEDAVQDAMLSAFKHITSFNGRAKMSTSLTAIVINAIRMQIRRRPRVRLLSMDYSANEGQPAIAFSLIDARLRRRLRNNLSYMSWL